MNGTRLVLAGSLAIAGVGYAVLIGIMAIALAGAGHGWISGIWSGLGVFLLPVFGIAIAYRRSLIGRVLLAGVAIGMIALDGFLVYMAWDEGVYYLRKVWEHGGFVIWVVWLGLWTSWQLAVVGVAILGPRYERLAHPGQGVHPRCVGRY